MILTIELEQSVIDSAEAQLTKYSTTLEKKLKALVINLAKEYRYSQAKETFNKGVDDLIDKSDFPTEE